MKIVVLTTLALSVAITLSDAHSDLDYLHAVAHEVVDASRVALDGQIPNGPKNATGYVLRVPGGTQNFYPAFWIRDAAMMLGADFVPADEVLGWLRLVALVQPGSDGRSFAHGLTVPGFSVPDHITLKGEACWFPGAYADQGVGNYGYLPPADDAFYFIQMAYEATRLTRDPSVFTENFKSGWGEHPLSDLCDGAFNSVAVDRTTGLVVCSASKGQTRVDWGFCDSIRKSGMCLMPSLLRWQAARRMSAMYKSVGNTGASDRYDEIARVIQRNIQPTFNKSVSLREGLLVSATGQGHKDDVWASAFAIWLGILPRSVAAKLATHLLNSHRVRQNRPGRSSTADSHGRPLRRLLGRCVERAGKLPKRRLLGDANRLVGGRTSLS